MPSRSPVLTAMQAMAVLGPAATLFCMIHNGEPLQPGWWLLAMPFLGLAILPYLLLLSAVKHASNARTIWFFFGVMLCITLGALLILWEAFWLRPDPQAGLVFLFLPLYQIAIVMVARLLIRLASRRPRQ